MHISNLVKNLQAAIDFGFKWPNSLMILDHISSEIEEIKEALKLGDRSKIKDEIGDLFHAYCSFAVFYGKSAFIIDRNEDFKFESSNKLIKYLTNHISLFKSNETSLDCYDDFIKTSFSLVINLCDINKISIRDTIKNTDQKFLQRFNNVKCLVPNEDNINHLSVSEKLDLWKQAKEQEITGREIV